jgi:hypothetical protein
MQDDDGRNGKNPFILDSLPHKNAKTVDTITPPEPHKQLVEEKQTSKVEPDIEKQYTSDLVQWSASSGNNHKRGVNWYLAGVGVIFALVAVAFVIQFFTNEWQFWTTVGLAIIIFLTLIIVNRRPPELVNYSIDNSGISINSKTYSFDKFRTFGLANDGTTWAATLIPVKHLSAGVTLTVPADQGEIIVDKLGQHLPMENVGGGFINEISRRFKL